MRALGYQLFKRFISVSLFCYYQKIQLHGLEHVPKNEPVLFLSNHQNALLDVLLIATRCSRKPWFLTRSDVFKNAIYKSMFGFLRMLPIYRIRDGKQNLSKNQAVFDRCSNLLAENEAIVIFPEANHNLERRVRPLSKGFTRIVDQTLTDYPEKPMYLVPIGQNYMLPTQIGDAACLRFGKPIVVKSGQYEGNVHELKRAVSDALKNLTTHIEPENYIETVSKLDKIGVNYLMPETVNAYINGSAKTIHKTTSTSSRPARFLFYMLNLPMVLLWRVLVKPKVPEPEFMGTFRFGFSIVAYPLFYLALLTVLQYSYGWTIALCSVMGHFALNLILVKVFGITSSAQKR